MKKTIKKTKIRKPRKRTITLEPGEEYVIYLKTLSKRKSRRMYKVLIDNEKKAQMA